MKRRTKVAIAAAGAVPLVLSGSSPAQAAPASATRTITINGAECTFRGTSEVGRAQGTDSVTIEATTTLVEPAPDACREDIGFWVTIRYRREGSDFTESATGTSVDGAEANVLIQLESAPPHVSVDHTLFYPCGRTCIVEWSTNPK